MELKDLDIGRRYVLGGVAYLHTGESEDNGDTFLAFVLTGVNARDVVKVRGDAVVELVQEQAS